MHHPPANVHNIFPPGIGLSDLYHSKSCSAWWEIHILKKIMVFFISCLLFDVWRHKAVILISFLIALNWFLSNLYHGRNCSAWPEIQFEKNIMPRYWCMTSYSRLFAIGQYFYSLIPFLGTFNLVFRQYLSVVKFIQHDQKCILKNTFLHIKPRFWCMTSYRRHFIVCSVVFDLIPFSRHLNLIFGLVWFGLQAPPRAESA